MGYDLIKLLVFLGVVLFIGAMAQIRDGRSGIRWGFLTLVLGGAWWLLVHLIFVSDPYLSRYDPNVMAICEILAGPVVILFITLGILKARPNR